MPKFAGKIEVDIRDSEPDWAPFLAPQSKPGAPNVLMIAWDDVGYGTMECYGGPVKTPTMNRIADMGIRFSNFHTTALCSPTRASLLTGRNATTNGMATIAEFASGFPGISTRIPFESGFISEVLLEKGYTVHGTSRDAEISSFAALETLGLRDRATLPPLLTRLCEQVAAALQRKGYAARTIGIKLRYADFKTVTRDLTLPAPVADAVAIRRAAGECLKRGELDRALRLLGVRAASLAPRPATAVSS